MYPTLRRIREICQWMGQEQAWIATPPSYVHCCLDAVGVESAVCDINAILEDSLKKCPFGAK
jgi:hypothetical protein